MILDEKTLFKQPPPEDENCKYFRYWRENHGSCSAAAAVDDLLAGKRVQFAITTKTGNEHVIEKLITWGIVQDHPTLSAGVRFGGGDDGTDPKGWNSHLLPNSTRGETEIGTPPELAAAMADALAVECSGFRGQGIRAEYFRLKNL